MCCLPKNEETSFQQKGNGHGLLKKTLGVLSTELFWGIEFFSM
jgi:hypothetical protein